MAPSLTQFNIICLFNCNLYLGCLKYNLKIPTRPNHFDLRKYSKYGFNILSLNGQKNSIDINKNNLKLARDEIPLKVLFNVSRPLFFPGFVSTSKNKKVAKDFSNEGIILKICLSKTQPHPHVCLEES